MRLRTIRQFMRMCLGKIKRIIRLFAYSFVIWCVLTTILPQLGIHFTHSKPVAGLNQIPNSLQNKKIQLLIAHPDDEVMFFAPTLIELSRPQLGNKISVVCFSNGNAAGIGSLRGIEVVRSLQILGITDVTVLEDENKFKDGMDVHWAKEDIVQFVDSEADILLTFDEEGISNHPNHKALFFAVHDLGKPLLSLKSWNILIKYSSTLFTNYELLFLRQFGSKNLKIYSDLPSVILGTAAMSFAHHSQMVWFRWGWLVLSRYTNTNELIRYNF